MLSDEDNEILTRVGPGTAMGDLFRQYWLPVLTSSELPERDGPPKRVRMLGENLIAFRTTSGQVGLLANKCSHRGASLFFGRNEDDGLRCVYHGWKYDVSGRCVDMPNEPPESDFKDKIRHCAYPCREANGVVWAYLGPRQATPAAEAGKNGGGRVLDGGPATGLPPLPDLEWLHVPRGHYAVGRTLRECNWLQALEGDIDNAHVPFLHSQLDFRREAGSATQYYKHPPHLEVTETPYGAMYGVRRDGEPGEYNWRIIQFLFPSFSMITVGTPRERGVVPSHLWVPIDDEHTAHWAVRWKASERLPDETPQSRPGDYLPNGSGWADQWQPIANRSNDYLIDREMQKTINFSGLSSIPLQDKMATESMGRIMDRGREHLGTTDGMIVRVRRRLIAAAKALRDEGLTPPCVDQPELYRVRSAIVNLSKEANWIEATREVVRATAFAGSSA